MFWSASDILSESPQYHLSFSPVEERHPYCRVGVTAHSEREGMHESLTVNGTWKVGRLYKVGCYRAYQIPELISNTI